MIKRLVNLPKNNSFFLFGARGTGKTTLLKQHFKKFKNILWIDLLKSSDEEKYLLDPDLLERQIKATVSGESKVDWVIIDEVQKVPKLLNIAHLLIEDLNIKFALTGSSSRKLKQKGVNLLAGRAWVKNLFPFSFEECQSINSDIDLKDILQWGSLPKVIELSKNTDKAEFLSSYVQTYIKSEIQEEQWVRKIEPFRKFLPIAGQMNGKPLNYHNISKDVGVDDSTIRSYYEILEDTLLGFQLPSFNRSIRQQQRLASKFYFFDLGVKRQLERKLTVRIEPGTSEFGDAFEHFVILEIFRLNSYNKKDFELSYLLTKDNVEIDLILDRPGRPLALIEIKSKAKVDERDVKHLELIGSSIDNCELFLISNDTTTQKIKNTQAYHWSKGIKKLFD